MRAALRLLAVPLLALGLHGLTVPAPAAPTAAPTTTPTTTPATSAAALEPLVVKTVRIGGKRVRFVLAVDRDERAFVRMKLRRDGRWKTVASDRTDCKYYDGSYDPGLVVQKPVKQVLIGWFGPGGDETNEYGGYNVRQRTIEMYGADACTAAG
ncbi:hypothetical protein [Nocardioides pelophilus]|uniref:hypothetical protein n=1 Tax=Nocardioides pelophilus TaxID=2172019 RepID=UPI0016031EC0|nr:hypothetical protein [Nocardioides pelophilus]